LQAARQAAAALKTALSVKDSEIMRLKTQIDAQTVDLLRLQLSAAEDGKEIETVPPNRRVCHDRESQTKQQTNDELAGLQAAKTEAAVLRAQINSILQKRLVESDSLKTGVQTLRCELAEAISDCESFEFEYREHACNFDWSRGQDGHTKRDQALIGRSRENQTLAQRFGTKREKKSEEERLGPEIESIEAIDYAAGESSRISALPRGRLYSSTPKLVRSISGLSVH